MRNKIKMVREYIKSDYSLSTTMTSAISAIINLFFAVFNGVLGIVYSSLWNGTICVYYLLLAVIRIIIVIGQRKEIQNAHEVGEKCPRRIFISTHILLLLMDISLIIPIIVMVKGERSYTHGLIPAIAMGAYTTYRMTVGIIHYHKSRKMHNPFVAELRMINFADALVALLSSQNALIVANVGMNNDMTILSAWKSSGILIIIFVMTIQSFLNKKKGTI